MRAPLKALALLSLFAVHAAVSAAGAFATAFQFAEAYDALRYLLTLGVAASVVSTVCFGATMRYLSKVPGALCAAATGATCGAVSTLVFGLTFMNVSISLVQFLAVFAPGLLAVLLASISGRRLHR